MRDWKEDCVIYDFRFQISDLRFWIGGQAARMFVEGVPLHQHASAGVETSAGIITDEK